MPLLKLAPGQKKVLAVATVIAAIAALFFLKKYLMLIIVSAIIAYLFNPVHQWLIRRGRSPGQAAVLTFFLSSLALIIPVFLIAVITIWQVEALTRDLTADDVSTALSDAENSFINWANSLLADLGASYQLTTQGLADAISSAAESVSQTIVSGLASSISGIFSFITTAIIYIYVFMSMLRHQDKIISTSKLLNPLGDEASGLYLNRIGAMTKATVRGQFIIAFLQGLESAIVLSIVGLSDLFFFFLMLLTALSVIPLGAGIVTIPIGIIMILTGNVWQGVLVIANHLLIVTNIDNVMRPRLVPDKARLDPALMILAVFSGIAYFGFFGIIIGPVIMIILLTTVQMFLEVYRSTESLKRGADKRRRGLLKRLSGFIGIDGDEAARPKP